MDSAAAVARNKQVEEEEGAIWDVTRGDASYLYLFHTNA